MENYSQNDILLMGILNTQRAILCLSKATLKHIEKTESDTDEYKTLCVCCETLEKMVDTCTEAMINK